MQAIISDIIVSQTAQNGNLQISPNLNNSSSPNVSFADMLASLNQAAEQKPVQDSSKSNETVQPQDTQQSKPVENAKDSDEGEAVSTSELRKEIAVAIAAQNKRQSKRNAFLTPCEIEKYCVLNSECKMVLEKAVNKYDFSPRAEASCKKLARTLSDMKGLNEISPECLNEAISLRSTPLGLDMDF